MMRPTGLPALNRNLCASCSKAWTASGLVSFSRTAGLQGSDRIQKRHKAYIAPPGEQAYPIAGYYAEMLKKPMPQVQPLTHTAPEAPPAESLPKTQKEETLEKARIVFGSRLAGPGERRKEIEEASQVIAGIMVPPKPTEPDNCCMSGCVNCVWDLYRDEMEEWAAKSAEARAAMKAQRQDGKIITSKIPGSGQPSHVAMSMDDDGGGSETNWSEDSGSADLFGDIPVGIREFMRTEKKLKQMHQKETTASA